MIFFTKAKTHHKPHKVGPYQLYMGWNDPYVSRVITPVTHLFSAIHRGYFTPFITGFWGPPRKKLTWHFDRLATTRGRIAEAPTMIFRHSSGGELWLSGVPVVDTLQHFPALSMQITCFPEDLEKRGGIQLARLLIGDSRHSQCFPARSAMADSVADAAAVSLSRWKRYLPLYGRETPCGRRSHFGQNGQVAKAPPAARTPPPFPPPQAWLRAAPLCLPCVTWNACCQPGSRITPEVWLRLVNRLQENHRNTLESFFSSPKNPNEQWEKGPLLV